MMEKGKSEMEEEKKSSPGTFNLFQVVGLTSVVEIWSCLKQLRVSGILGEFLEFEI